MSEHNKNQFAELEKALKGLQKPVLTSQKKDAIKADIFGPMQYMQRMAGEVRLDQYRRTRLKENVFLAMEKMPQRSFFWSQFFLFNKKLVSAFLLMFMMFGFLSFLNVNMEIVFADTFTTLDDFQGQVRVERNGQEMIAERGMRLYESDSVETGDGSLAVIKYLDDSVSRLSENGRLLMSQLDQDENNSAKTYVRVSLAEGNLWSRVVNLVSDQSVFVVQAKDVYTKTNRAAFNVRVDEQTVQVQVFSREVNVQSDGNVSEVASGEKAVVVDNYVAIQTISKSEHDLAWVQDNLESDKGYVAEVEDRLLAAKLDGLGVKKKEDVSFNNSLIENASLFLTFDDVEKKKKELDLAEKKFVAAEVKLHDQFLTKGEQAEISNAITDFDSNVKNFYQVIENVRGSDPEYAAELEAYVNDKLSVHNKDLATVSPSSPSFEAKKVINDLSLLDAEDEDDAKLQRLGQLLDDLAMLEDAGLNSENLSEESLNSYISELEEAKSLVSAWKEPGAVTKQELGEKLAHYSSILVKLSGGGEVAAPQGEGENTAKVEPVKVEVEGEFGVKIEGDKILPPGL
ncbi:MAG: FecR domain-containing protein [Candidatus Gracilibacteria bacterium]